MRNPEADYHGPGVVVLDGHEYPVHVRLNGHHQPIDGVYRWYGRIDPDPALDAATGSRKHRVEIRTPEGKAAAALGDRDFWGRLRITGRSVPPYRIPTAEDVEPRAAW